MFLLEASLFLFLFWLIASLLLGSIALAATAILSRFVLKLEYGFANEIFCEFYYSIEHGLSTRKDRVCWWFYVHFGVVGLYVAAWLQFALAIFLIIPLIRLCRGRYEDAAKI